MPATTEKRPTRRVVLTQRDLEILRSLYMCRYCSIEQLRRLHFVSLQTATRRLRLLAAAGHVGLFHVPGVPDRIAFLTEGGRELLGEHLELPPGALGLSRARVRPKDAYFMRHALGITDFRIALTQACARVPDLSLLGFIADHVVEQTNSGAPRRLARDIAADMMRSGEKVGHTPDGVFAIMRGGTSALFFLEVDRGTETVSHQDHGFARAIRFYLSYLAQGGYARYQEVFGLAAPFTAVRVLVATSARRRLENIRSVGAALGFQPAQVLRLIWLAELSELTEATIFSRLWVSLDPTDTGTYRILQERDRIDSAEGSQAHE